MVNLQAKFVVFNKFISPQTYIYAKLYNCTDVYHTEDMLETAKMGGEFLLRHAYRSSDGRCYHSVSREGNW